MLKNLHRPKKLVIFTLVKGDAIYHTIPNGKTGNTHIYRKKKGKTPSYGIGCTCGTIPRHTAETPLYAVKTRNNNTTGQHTAKTNFQPPIQQTQKVCYPPLNIGKYNTFSRHGKIFNIRNGKKDVFIFNLFLDIFNNF